MAHLKRAVALFAEVGERRTGARPRDLGARRLVIRSAAAPYWSVVDAADSIAMSSPAAKPVVSQATTSLGP